MRKKFLLMTFLLAIIGFCGTNLRAQGDLQITTEEELRNFASAVNGGESYEGKLVTLVNDITLASEWTPIGNGARSSKTYTGNSFKGIFDGGNHTISGLTITSTTADDAAIGLFGIVDGGTVKNLNLTDVNINVASSDLAGAAIGMMLNGATADNITVSGAIVGHDGVGGIVGRLIIHGTISNCINNASVTSSYGGIGGIVGKPYYEDGTNTSTFASITNCINNGTVTAPMYIGGIAGLARANVTDCINEGAVVGGTQTGGIVGQLIAAGTVSGNENKAKVSGKNHLGGIIGDYSQSNAYTYYNVSIANNINRGELAATEQCAAIMGCNNIDGFTDMTASGNVSYYYVDGLELFGNPEDMVIDETNKFIIPVAKIGDVEYSTLAEAVAEATEGETITMLADAAEDVTIPAGVSFNGNGKAVGNITAAGTITFNGHTKATSFNVENTNTTVNIVEGACLEITGTGRMVIGHGCTFNVTGSIGDAKTADKATLTPSLVMPGASFTGAGVTFNVTNAYISAPSSYCSSSSSASGTFDFNITNSIWESAGKLAFESQSTAATVNFDLVESVLNTGSHLVFGVSRGEVVIDNSNVNVGTSRQIENQSTMTIKNGSVVNGAVATSSNAKNPGTLIVEGATYAVTGEFSGSDLGTGTLIMKNGARFTAGSITKANIQIDATGMAIGDEINLTANLANHAGTLEVINNDNLDAEIKDGKIVLVEKPVAQIGTVKYGTLNEALNAAAQTEELTTIQLLAGTHTFGDVKFPATLKNVTIVGADNKATIIKDSKLHSADGNAVTYKGITFDGIVFDNSSILFTGARNGEVVYEDWTIKNCDFRNLQSSDGIAAIHFNLASDETIKNFTFENNTITNVSSPNNTASGLRLNYVTGKVVIKDNETNNVAFNAVQIINSAVDSFTFEGNILRSNNSSLANLYNVTGDNIVITENQFLANEGQNSVSGIASADVSGNYWGGGAPTNLPEGVVYSSYYTTVESDGTLGGLVELPKGDQPIGYVSETTIWGETWSNARESYVIKVKDADGNVMGTSTLNPELYTFNGNQAPTWHISFDPSTDNDTYWIQEWTTAPSIDNMPAKVALWVDGVEVNEGQVKFNGPDDLNKMYAATADAEGKLIRFYNSIETIVNNDENVNVVLVRDVTGSFETFRNVTLYSGVEGAAITNTYSADYTNFNKVIVKNGVTLNMNNVFSTTAESVNTIEGTMNVVGVYYHSSDAKTEIKNGGKVTTGGMTIVRYNNNPESGIYIYGDGDDATIEFSCQGDAIGAYSGTFYAEDAEVETKGLRLDYKKDDSEESDEYAQINAKFVDTKLSVSSELRLYKDAALTLNGATVTAGKVQIRQNATPTINIDNSTIKANSVENLSGATWNAVMDEDGYVTFVRTGLAGGGTEENPYLINNLEDLVFFRDQVNGGNNYAGKYVALTADINLNNEEWTPIGNDTNKFQGYFDGNEKTISNLKISGNNKYVGLFGYILGQGMSASTTPSVKDLTLDGVNVSGDYYVGGLAGQAYTCNITNVTVKGNVSGVRYVGGLVGHVYTYFKDCHFIGNASCSFDALGGIAGAGDCRAYDCSVIGEVSGSNWVGGIVGNGQEGTSAVGCYVKGNVKTSNNYYRGVGGIAGVVGHGYASSEFKNNYFDGEVYLGDVKVPAMIMGLVNAIDNASIKATVEGNSWNTYYYDVNTPVYVVAEISSSNASLEDWIAGTSVELTKPRNNNLVMLESDIQYVEATDIDDVTIMKFSEVTEDDILPQIEENNQVAYIDSNADGAYTEGETKYTSFEEALNAAQENAIITLLKDIKIAERTVINNRTLTIDGNGKTIRQDENFDNTIAMFDITGGKVTINNVIFDGVKKGAVVRTVGTEFAMDNVTAQNSVHTVGQGLFRLVGQNTITNSKFLNNNCSMVITLNYDGESNTPQLVENCLFEGNECNSVAALYYVKGAGCTIKDSEFVENTVNCNNNGATVYLGFTENNVVTGNIFDSNSVIDASTSTRVAGAIFFGYEAEITNNVFVENTASNANNDVLGQICTSTYYDCTIDLSGNYWGGEAPEYGKDYTIQHTASERPGVFQLDNYYKTFTTDENGNVELGNIVYMNYVAQVGKFSYETLTDAFAAAENETITLLIDTELSEMITIPNGKTVVLDLNGKIITGTDKGTASFGLITNKGNLTITDSSEEAAGKITLEAEQNRGWNAYSSVISNTVGGKLTVDGGTLEHLGGTDMAYGIDNLTNGKGTYAETVINGGYIKSTYRAIRQFLNGIEAQNILTVNGGTIEGANKSIWMQDPSKNANTGTLTVGTDAKLIGDVYLFVTAGSTEWPVEVSIAKAALAEGSTVLTGNVPAGYELQTDENNNYVVNGGFAKIGEIFYATLQEAIDAVEDNETIVLIRDNNENIVAGNENQKPFNKIFTIDGADFNVTGKWVFGRDDHNQDESNVTIKNVNFTKYGVKVDDFASVTISGCKFTGVEGNAIYVAADEYTSSIVVENCVITNPASAGINFRNPVNATVKGNKINGTGNNSITFQHGTAYTEAETGEYIIENNIFQNWANEASEGRALRIATGVKPRAITIENNVMIKDNAPEEFVKVTGNTDNVSVDENYWNGANPTSSNTPAYFLAEGVQVHNYYATYNAETNELSDLVTIAGETLELYYTAECVETTQDQASYSLMFNVTDYAEKEVSVKIGSKKPAQNSNIDLVTPSEVVLNDVTYNVTSLADRAFFNTQFKTVTISEGVRTIEEYALANMYALTDVVFPSTLTYLENAIFSGYGLEHKIKTVTTYAETPAATVAATSFQQYVGDKAVLIVYNGNVEDYRNAQGWKRFKNILGVGSEIEIAGKDDKYSLIATITSMDPMECSVKIGQKPAANSMAELVIPETVDFVESIDGFDFTVTSIPNNAFMQCYNFTGDLNIPASVKSIGNSAFLQAYYNNTNIGKLTLNEGLETISNSAFTLSYFNNENLVIPSTVTTIGSHAFNATGMNGTLTVKNNIAGGFNGFAGSLFTKLVIEESVNSIVDESGKGIFAKMTKLEEVTLPATLTNIGALTFSESTAITTITTSATNPPVVANANAFASEVFANATLFVPNHAAKALYKEANVWNEFAHISTPIIEQTTQLSAGWNWFSYYVNTDLETLETALGENGVQITGKLGFKFIEGGNWYGTLTSISPDQMYLINVNDNINLALTGETFDKVEVTLNPKWNWIGYPSNVSISVNEALDGLTPQINDQITGKEGFATYFGNTTGWVGTLQTLEPGRGYKYHSNNTDIVTFEYTNSRGKGEVKANVTTDGNHWIPNAGQYPNNMTMTAMVEVEGGDYEVAAFVDGEVRGSARPIYVEALDAHILFLTIHGDETEEMTFRYYDIATGEEYELNDRINYSNDAIIGSLKEPYIFNRGTTGIGEASLSDINIYPNPTTTGTEINLQSTCDTVEVFNALGVKVAEYHNVDSIDAFETAGIYVIRITDNGDVKHCRLIVK